MKKDKIKKFMIELFFVEIILLLCGLIFIMKPNAEIISQRPNLSSDYGGDYSNQVIDGIRWHLIGGSPVITTLYAYYDYRMANLERRYTLSFWVYSQGSTPYVTINGQPCNTLPNDYQIQNSGNYNAYEQVQGYTWLINCVNIAPDPNQFYVRIGNIKSSLSPSLQGIGANFYVDSYPSESAAINGAISQIQEALIQNNNTNTNNIVNSVNNMTNQLMQKQTEANQISQETLNYIKDDTPPTSDYTFSPQFESGGVLTNLINLPLTMVSTLMNALSNQCVPFTARLPFVDTDLTIPCISEFISSIGASAFFEGIGATAGGFILYNYLKYLALLFDKSLRFELTIKDVI